MRTTLGLALLGLAAATASGQTDADRDRPLSGDTVKLSEHVWQIVGWPNVGIVVGKDATLVVDTGLGPRNGATVAAAAKRLAPGNKLYLTTTHFHPEHAGGVAGFPEGTVLIRPKVQQDELDAHGAEMIRLFEGMNPRWKEALVGAKFRDPDRTFDREHEIDLGGGVTARLLWFGAAHTKGDELTFVLPDRTLISGDVVQNKVVPNIFGDGGTPSSWIAVLDEVAKLGAEHVLPTHSPPGDGSLVAQEKAFLVDLRDRGRDLKAKGVAVEEAGRRLTDEFRKRYPDWPIKDVTAFVRSIYAE